MNIQILQCIEGAKQARGLTVIIDVFRAFTVEACLMQQGARQIIPVGDVASAFAYKAVHPDTVLCGERGGRIIDGFDFGNSPSQIAGVDFTGKTVVHTTSAGTQGIVSATGAEEILGGSLVCAGAIARYIRHKNPEQVSLVCMGLEGKTPTQEDTLCARYIRSLLEGTPLPEMPEEIEILRRTSGAKFFDPAQKDIFPPEDFTVCTQAELFPFVLRLRKDAATGLSFMERISI